MDHSIRTDLADEARDLSRGGNKDVEGVKYEEKVNNGNKVRYLEVLNETGAKNIGKPVGRYCTVETGSVRSRQEDGFESCARLIAEQLKAFLPQGCDDTLAVGLGNRDITPDAVGPLCAESVLVTRHLKERMPEDFAAFSSVSVIVPGVLGTSGIESSAYVKSVCAAVKPKAVIVVDALAAADAARLCTTVQITDTGISPGSGVGNDRQPLNSSSLGCPVIAVGIPTVIDVGTLLRGSSEDAAKVPDTMFVTPRSIDTDVSGAARLIAYAVNFALHDGLAIGDIDMLLG